MGVEAARHEHPVGRVARRQRCDELVDRAEVEVAGCTGGKRHVARRADAVVDPDLVEATRPGIQRPFVERHVRDARIVVEDLLRAVAVVRVVVDDQDAITAVREQRPR